MSVYGFYKTAKLVHFINKDGEREWKDKYTLLRGVAQNLGLSFEAKQKLEWMIFYNSVGKHNACSTALYFGISRKTLHKWLKRFDESNLRSLEESSRAPVKRRAWEVTLKEQQQIISLRKRTKYKYGKAKLKTLYEREYRENISTWKIQRVISKYNLYKEKTVKRRISQAKRKKKAKIIIHDIKKKNVFGFLWHIDAIIIWWYGTRRVIFTAIEETTKIAFARVYKTNSSAYASDFLKRLMYLVEGEVEIMHSDNGSEFAGEFEDACQLLSIKQVYSRPRTPKDNPALERFNWTIQDEWLSLSEVGLDDIYTANQDLAVWLVEYNNYRPHHALDNMTPLEYAHQNYYQVLPMWPAQTLNLQIYFLPI